MNTSTPHPMTERLRKLAWFASLVCPVEYTVVVNPLASSPKWIPAYSKVVVPKVDHPALAHEIAHAVIDGHAVAGKLGGVVVEAHCEVFRRVCHPDEADYLTERVLPAVTCAKLYRYYEVADRMAASLVANGIDSVHRFSNHLNHLAESINGSR